MSNAPTTRGDICAKNGHFAPIVSYHPPPLILVIREVEVC